MRALPLASPQVRETPDVLARFAFAGAAAAAAAAEGAGPS